MSTKKKKPETPKDPPNISVPAEDIPSGCILIKGDTTNVRAAKLGIPYGMATRRVNKWTVATVGIIIREEDKERFDGPKPKENERP